MYKQCPTCGSVNVCRSHSQSGVRWWWFGLMARYRCLDCTVAFRMVSQRAYVHALVLSGSLIFVVLVALLWTVISGTIDVPVPTDVDR